LRVVCTRRVVLDGAQLLAKHSSGVQKTQIAPDSTLIAATSVQVRAIVLIEDHRLTAPQPLIRIRLAALNY
jgi:hypothetical protein